MVAYTFNMPLEETLVDKIRKVIDTNFELTETLRLDGASDRQIAALNKKLIDTAKEIERLTLGL